MATLELKNIPTYVLTLSNDEAKALSEVIARIGGSPEKSQRKHIDSIAEALTSAGFLYTSGVMHGSLAFVL